MRRLNCENTSKEMKTSGLYTIFSKERHKEYVGSSKNIRRRVSSYHQKDDFEVHPTKKALRPHAHFYRVEHMKIAEARRLEKLRKRTAPHNVSIPGGQRTAHKKKKGKRRH